MRKYVDYLPQDTNEATNLLAGCCPQGLAWEAKRNRASNLYALLAGLSISVRILEERLYALTQQWNVNITDDLIVEWETAVGIPDECRKAADDIATRRQDVIDKLRKIPVITIDDYKELAAAITGLAAADFNIRPGSDDYPSDPLYKHVLLVGIPSIITTAFTMPFGNTAEMAISALTSDGTTATATVVDTSTLVDGATVVIAGADQDEYNGSFAITVIDETTFIYSLNTLPITPTTLSVTLLTSVGSTAVAVVADTSDLVEGMLVEITGATQTEYNGTFSIHIVDGSSFEYTFDGSATSPATGTIEAYFEIPITPATGTITASYAVADDPALVGEDGNAVYMTAGGVMFGGYPFPAAIRSAVLRCVFRKVTPATVAIVFTE